MVPEAGAADFSSFIDYKSCDELRLSGKMLFIYTEYLDFSGIFL